MKTKIFYSFLIFSFLSLNNCERVASVFFSDSSDVEMGLAMDREIRLNRQFKILHDSELTAYVQSIVKEILRSPNIKKSRVYPYKVTLIDDDETINAFCTPGGYIYVYSGLIKILDNEASLAAVLAHEIAHAERRHVRQRMLSAFGIQLLVSVLIGDNASIFKEMGVKLAGDMAILANSRGDEMEADQWGFLYLGASPYYQGAMSYFFQKILEDKKRDSVTRAIEKFISTHPIPEERLLKNKERIKKAKLEGASEFNLFHKRYEVMKKRL